MDIRPKTQQVIDLRGVKKDVKPVEVKLEVKPEVKPVMPKTVPQPQCSKCGSGNENYLRCQSCEAEHQALVAKLPPPVKAKKHREKLYELKVKRQGIICTDIYTEEDLQIFNMIGRPLPQGLKEIT